MPSLAVAAHDARTTVRQASVIAPGKARGPYAAPVDADVEGRVRLGRRLRQLRADAGMTLQEVASRAQLSMSYVANVELAQRQASLPALRRLAAAHNVLTVDLLQGVFPYGTADPSETGEAASGAAPGSGAIDPD